MSILLTVIVGFLAGTAAKYIMPGEEGGGFIMTTLLGIAGAFVGRFLGGLLGIAATSMVGGFLTATGGAIVLLFVYSKLRPSQA
ncbi:MAG: GlsB/YeaQ/YmgE family stress response membrane protein [Rhodothermales bacterium]|nr:GlsB/YeaQ/YmgE family stress response membrane protein [Rhodothermales bacterium]MBO6780162.1 GlsB/YeaQ/YmgE family stress response membrane protein [Rhodothermales bacterium]